MSKISPDQLAEAVAGIKKGAQDKKRKFLETVELQFGLKNYDPQKDKKFSGTLKLPTNPRPKFKVCIIGNQAHCDGAKAAGIDFLSVDDLKKMNKNKKLVKKMAAKYQAFLASNTLIKQIPRLLGPGLNRAGKFPAVLGERDDVTMKVDEIASTIKFQLKSKRALCLSIAIGNVGMSDIDIITNITLACNFLASLLKKQWQQIKRVHIKSTMGPSFRIFGF